MSNTIAENLCTAIGIIADAAVEKEQFDKTIICTIVDDSHLELDGYYTVTDGSMQFAAYSENTSYKIDDQVYVTIPQGDYSQQKFIASKYIADNQEPVPYVYDMDTMHVMHYDYKKDQMYDINVPGTLSVMANNSKATSYSASVVADPLLHKNMAFNSEYDAIGISADFYTNLHNLEVREGTYGLRLDIKQSHQICSLYFNSENFFGNPYGFRVYLNRAQKLPKDNGKIHSMQVTLFQNGDFKCLNEDGELVSLPEGHEIQVTNIKIWLGYNLTPLEEDQFYIRSYITADYSDNEVPEGSPEGTMPIREMQGVWLHKNENNEDIYYSDGVPDVNYDEELYLKQLNLYSKYAAAAAELVESDFPQTLPAIQIYQNANDINKEYNDIAVSLLQINKKASSLTNTLSAFDSETSNVMSAVNNNIANAQVKLHAYAEITSVTDVDTTSTSIKTKYLNWLKSFPGPEVLEIPEHGEIVTSIETLKTSIEALSTAIRAKVDGVYQYSSDTFNYVDQFIEYCAQIFELIEKHYTILDNLYTEQAMAGQQLGNYETSFSQEHEQFIEQNANKYCIYWYHYKKDYVDDISHYVLGKGWEKLPSTVSDWSAARSGSVMITPPQDKTLKPDQPCYQKVGDCDLESSSTQFRAVLFYNHVPYESNMLTFINASMPEEEIPIMDGIYIDLDANAMDVYPVYNTYYTLLNSADAYIDRKLRVRYVQNGELRDDLLAERSNVFWYLPDAVSQLIILDEELCGPQYGFTNLNRFVEKLTLAETVDANYFNKVSSFLMPGYTCYCKHIAHIENYTEEGEEQESNADTLIFHRIASIYSPMNIRNEIICRIEIPDEINGGMKLLEAKRAFAFNTFGTSGTQFTLTVGPGPNQAAIVYKDGAEKPLPLIASFTDAAYQTIDLDIYWEWEANLGNLNHSENSVETNYNSRLISSSGGSHPSCDYNIIRCHLPWNNISNEVEADETLDLYAFYPIPYAIGGNYCLGSGASTVTYNDLGASPAYSKGIYTLYNLDTHKIVPASWSIKHYDKNGNPLNSKPTIGDNPTEDELALARLYNYLPTLKTDNNGNSYLRPLNLYISDLEVYSVVEARVNGNLAFAQPIFITQNRWGSSLLNSWDEKLYLDEENGIVLGTMIGAGRKDEQNRFHGVLMGDVTAPEVDSDTLSAIGLYGFHQGAQSFGFKVDGTAFLGKSGAGRIHLDGNNSFIYSANWLNSFTDGKSPFTDPDALGMRNINRGTDGMAIDLADGHIDAFNFQLTSNNVNFNSGNTVSIENPYYMNIETSPLSTSIYEARPNLFGIDKIQISNYVYISGFTEEGEPIYEEWGKLEYPKVPYLYTKSVEEDGTEVFTIDYNPKDVAVKIASYYAKYTYEEEDKSITTYRIYGKYYYPRNGERLYQQQYNEAEQVLYVPIPDLTLRDTSKEHYIYNEETETYDEYKETTYPLYPMLYEKVENRGKGYYHIRFDRYGNLELSLSNMTLLPDSGITLGGLITGIDSEFKYIENEVIGDPENPKPGTVYDHVAGEITRIEDEVIGTPDDLQGISTLYSYINAQEYITQETAFNKLTENGTNKGIYPVYEVNEDGSFVYTTSPITGEQIRKIKDLYINASYIATGILRSENWKGELTYHPTEGEPITFENDEAAAAAVDEGRASWDGTWSLAATEGTYWDLNKGQLWADTFELNAWDNPITERMVGSGLYVNSDPSPGEFYLSIGNLQVETVVDEDTNEEKEQITSDSHFIQYGLNANGSSELRMKVSNFALDAWNDNKGIILDSNPGADGHTDYWFSIGGIGNFIQFDENNKLVIQIGTSVTNEDGSVSDAGHFILNAWHDPTEDAEGNITKPSRGIYLNSDPVTKYLQDEEGNYLDKDNNITTNEDDYVITEPGIYFRAGMGDETTVATDTSEIIEVSENRVLISSKHFVFDAYNHDTFEEEITTGVDEQGNPVKEKFTYETGGIYLNSAPQIYPTAITVTNKDALDPNAAYYVPSETLGFKPIAFDQITVGQTVYTIDPDQYLHIGTGKNFIQYNANHELTICVQDLIIDAFNNREGYQNGMTADSKGGVHIDSTPSDSTNPNSSKYYLIVGNPNNFIQLTKDGEMTFQTDGRFVVNAIHDILSKDPETGEDVVIGQGGIYFNSMADGAPDSNTDDCYFQVGYDKYYMRFDGDGDLHLSVANIYGLNLYPGTTPPEDWDGSLTGYIGLESPTSVLRKALDQMQDTINAKVSPDAVTSHVNWAELTNDGELYGGFSNKDGTQYYINANYITTGAIASTSIILSTDETTGITTVTTKQDEETGKNLPGVYMNLDTGLLWSNDFDLLVQPAAEDLDYGTDEEGNSTDPKAAAVILSSSAATKATDATDNKLYYLYIGNEKGYIALDNDFKFSVYGKIEAIEGQIAGWKIEQQKSVLGRIYGTWTEGSMNYYLNLWSAFPNGSKGNTVVSGFRNGNWRIQAGYSTDDGYTFPKGFGVTREGYVAASRGVIAGWVLDENGLISSGGEMKVLKDGIYCTKAYNNNLNFISKNQYGIYNGVENSTGEVEIKTSSTWWNYAYVILNNDSFDVSTNVSSTNIEYYIVSMLPQIINGEKLPYVFCIKGDQSITVPAGYQGYYLIINKSGEADPITVSTTKSFELTPSEGLKAVGADISGTITADYLEANTGGKIGGWTIGSTTLSAGNVTLTATSTSSTATVINVNDKFKVTNSGKVTATNADITGTINADRGSIGDNFFIKSVYDTDYIPSLITDSDTYRILFLTADTSTKTGSFIMTGTYPRDAGENKFTTKIDVSMITPTEITDCEAIELIEDYIQLSFQDIRQACTINATTGEVIVKFENVNYVETPYTWKIRFYYKYTDKYGAFTVASDGGLYANAFLAVGAAPGFAIQPQSDGGWKIGATGCDIVARGNWSFQDGIDMRHYNVQSQYFKIMPIVEGGISDAWVIGDNNSTRINAVGWWDFENSIKGSFVSSSDILLKDKIQNFSNDDNSLFDALNPISFIYKKDKNQLRHFGFSAQNVLQALNTVGYTTQALVQQDAEGYLTLNYSELIALNTWQIQELKSQIQKQQKIINSLSALINNKGEKGYEIN